MLDFIVIYVNFVYRWSDKEDRLLLDIYHACMEKSNSLDSPNESKKEKTLGLPMKKIMMKALNRTLSSVDARLKILLEDEHARNLSQSKFYVLIQFCEVDF